MVFYQPSGLIVSNAVEVLHAFLGAGHRFAWCRHRFEIEAAERVFFFKCGRGINPSLAPFHQALHGSANSEILVRLGMMLRYW